MRHRPGVTLIEVLTAIFVMAIGLLALLVLYPVGALSMARGVRDDRAAAAAANAASLAIAFNLRDDSQATGGPPSYSNFPVPSGGSVGSTIYVDPFYASQRQFVGDSPTSLPRVGVSYVKTPADLSNYFTFQDEIVFANTGQPGTPGSIPPTPGPVNRPATYTYAYLLRHYGSGSITDTELSVVVYASRSTQLPMGEPVYSGNPLGTQGTSVLTLTYPAGNVAAKPNIQKGNWVLDVTTTYAPAVNGYFYRVDSLTDTGAGLMTLQLETPLKQTVTTLVSMQNVITVLDRGVAWKP